MTLQALFTQAAGLHQQGKLAEAEKLYLQLLQRDSASVPGRHLLGVLRFQQGRNKEAIELIGGALKTNPRDFGALINYGLVLQREQRSEEALAAYDRALAVRPDVPEAHYNRGVLLMDMQRAELALASFEAALKLKPGYAEALFNRGLLLQEEGRLEEALASYDRALAINPRWAGALDNRGNTLRALGRLEEALASYDRALSLSPGLANALYNRAVALSDLGRHGEALQSLDAALAAKPDLARAHYSRGLALRNLSRQAEALESQECATRYDPGLADAWNNRAFLLFAARRYDEAVQSYDRLLALQPDNAQAWNSRGSALREMKRPKDALVAFDKAIALDPGLTDAYANRAIVHWEDNKQYEPAAADLAKVLALDPDWPYAPGELLLLKMQVCDWQDYDGQRARIDEGVRIGRRVVQPFAYQAMSGSPADLQACSRIFAADHYPPAAPAPRPARRHDKLRIGYVSGEFREQATAHLMAGVYEQHDRDRFEIVGFDSGWNDGGPMRRRLEAAFGGFIDISRLFDRAAAERIAAERIDILVNLNGYFGDQRTGIFAHRPAPVQVNYLGFPATLGADYMDYILADRVVIPEQDKPFYTEKVVWLKGCYQANDSRRPIADAGYSRADAGLPENSFVFCNFNQSYKLTPASFGAWMRILGQVPGSVLWLWQSRPEANTHLRRAAEAAGIAGERLIFADGLPLAMHLARLKLADLFLDNLPYNAHTTASDALWAGVPLLTLRGTAFPGRVAASVLVAAGLPELVTETLEDYETRAVQLARDPAMLSSLREKLAANRLGCPLFDTVRFTRNIEAAYATMWDICRKGEAPRSFAVP